MNSEAWRAAQSPFLPQRPPHQPHPCSGRKSAECFCKYVCLCEHRVGGGQARLAVHDLLALQELYLCTKRLHCSGQRLHKRVHCWQSSMTLPSELPRPGGEGRLQVTAPHARNHAPPELHGVRRCWIPPHGLSSVAAQRGDGWVFKLEPLQATRTTAGARGTPLDA